jgi:hypothetical protein
VDQLLHPAGIMKGIEVNVADQQRWDSSICRADGIRVAPLLVLRRVRRLRIRASA